MNYPPSTPPPGSLVEEAPAPSRMVRVKRNTDRPLVTYILLGLTVFVYLLQRASEAGLLYKPLLALGSLIMGSELTNALVSQSGSQDLPLLIGAKISSLIIAGQYWRLLTPALLHASLTHIGFNMYALFAIGPSLESYYGRLRFLALYVLGALGGNVLSFWLSDGLSVGASTAIFGMVAAEGVFIYQNRKLFGANARRMLGNIVFIVAINLMLGLSGGIDNWGHLGGLLSGLAFAWFAGPRLAVDFGHIEPELIDQRSQYSIWLVAVTIAFVLAALALLRIRMG